MDRFRGFRGGHLCRVTIVPTADTNQGDGNDCSVIGTGDIQLWLTVLHELIHSMELSQSWRGLSYTELGVSPSSASSSSVTLGKAVRESQGHSECVKWQCVFQEFHEE